MTERHDDALVEALMEIDRLSLVIESAVRRADPGYKMEITETLKRVRAAIAAVEAHRKEKK